MHTITLKVQNTMYEHIMYLLKNLDKKEVEIVNDIKTSETPNAKQHIKSILDKKKSELFQSIDDPLAWQKAQRDEWK